MPLAFRSFGDYKAPLFIYLMVPFIKILGLTTFALRFPSALFGSLTVLLVYFLGQELFRKEKNATILSFLAAFFLAISPWHLQFSRVAFEPNFALFLVVQGVIFFLKGLRKNSSWLLSLGAIFLALSLYTYHSNKIFTPLLFLSLLIIYKKEVKESKKKLFFPPLIFFTLSFIIFIIFTRTGASRMKAAGIFGRFSTIEEIGKLRQEDKSKPDWLVRILHNRPIFLTDMVLKNYFTHFSSDFLFFGKKTNWRVSLPFQGQLYLSEAPFFLLGFIYLLFNLKKKNSQLILIWFFLSPLPASIADLNPHALRTLMMLPTPQIFTALGIVIFIKWLKKYPLFYRFSSYCFIIFSFIFFISYYFYNYYRHFPYESGLDWQEGHQEMVAFVNQYKGKTSKIIVTDYYMQPYIFFLWFGKIDPKVYQEKGLEGFEFRKIEWDKDKRLENVILVGTPEEIPENEKIINKIRFSNGQTAFKIVKT